jgi:CHAT domain-containing protein
LPYSQREAEAIAGLVPAGELFAATGFAASRQAVVAPQLGRYRIVHFATHGELDSEHPELSHLVLSRFDGAGRPVAGRLYAHEIYRLELPAELVTLSACRSALGEEVRGEGLVGLTQAFFHAGAARVLVSLWQVDDEATAALMAAFYRSLLAEGLPPAAALAAAQRSIFQQPRWRAPYYWAGFVLQGEWRPIAKHPPPRGEPTAQ